VEEEHRPEPRDGLGEDFLGSDARTPPRLRRIVTRPRREYPDPDLRTERHSMHEPGATTVYTHRKHIERVYGELRPLRPLAHHDGVQKRSILGRGWRGSGDHRLGRQAVSNEVAPRALRVRAGWIPVLEVVVDRTARRDDAFIAPAAEGVDRLVEPVSRHPTFDDQQARPDGLVRRQEGIQVAAGQQQHHGAGDEQDEPTPSGGNPDLSPSNQGRQLHRTGFGFIADSRVRQSTSRTLR